MILMFVSTKKILATDNPMAALKILFNNLQATGACIHSMAYAVSF